MIGSFITQVIPFYLLRFFQMPSNQGNILRVLICLLFSFVQICTRSHYLSLDRLIFFFKLLQFHYFVPYKSVNDSIWNAIKAKLFSLWVSASHMYIILDSLNSCFLPFSTNSQCLSIDKSQYFEGWFSG